MPVKTEPQIRSRQAIAVSTRRYLVESIATIGLCLLTCASLRETLDLGILDRMTMTLLAPFYLLGTSFLE
jgi:hypothetical protein